MAAQGCRTSISLARWKVHPLSDLALEVTLPHSAAFSRLQEIEKSAPMPVEGPRPHLSVTLQNKMWVRTCGCGHLWKTQSATCPVRGRAVEGR